MDLTTHFRLCYFEFYRLFCGAVAQLGERLNGIQEADGSIPFSSTNFKKRGGSGRIDRPTVGIGSHRVGSRSAPHVYPEHLPGRVGVFLYGHDRLVSMNLTLALELNLATLS